MKRGFISGVLTAAVGAALLAGCGSKPVEQPTGMGNGAAGDSTEIVSIRRETANRRCSNFITAITMMRASGRQRK